jgi:hypothetical protein
MLFIHLTEIFPYTMSYTFLRPIRILSLSTALLVIIMFTLSFTRGTF